MVDTQPWLLAKVRLQMLADCKIQEHELVSISFGASYGAQCLLSADGFIRLGKQFGITQVKLLEHDQPRFRFNNVEFVCVCTEEEVNRVAAEFKLKCSHAHLMESGRNTES